MKKNPVEEFLKTAGIRDTLGRAGGQLGSDFGKALAGGVATLAAGAAVKGVAMGAQKAYLALTRERDFNLMMSANPHLKDLHDQDPAQLHMAFNSLRSMNPELAGNPYVSGAYVQKAMSSGSGGSMLASEVYFPSRREQTPVVNSGINAAQVKGFRGFDAPEEPAEEDPRAAQKAHREDQRRRNLRGV